MWRVFLGFCLKCIPLFVRSKIPRVITKHLWFKGQFKLSLGKGELVLLQHEGYQLENEMFWYGISRCHEAKSHQITNDFLRVFRPKYFFDIGASTGTYGIFGKKIVTDIETFFFEPQTSAIELLERNIKVNNVESKIFKCALSDFSGNGKIFKPVDSKFVYSVTVNCNMNSKEIEVSEEEIAVARFDSLGIKIENTNAFFKIDAEYHELEVLKGFGHLLTEDLKLGSGWLIEVLADELGTSLEEVFPPEKFAYFDINEREFSAHRSLRLKKSSGYNYFIVEKRKASSLSSLSN